MELRNGFGDGCDHEEHARDVEYNGHARFCTERNSQYEIKSDKTNVLTKLK